MSRFKGWPVAYLGIASLSVGSGINSGIDSGLIVAGISLIIVGIGQACSA
jgi:hypothetical protein